VQPVNPFDRCGYYLASHGGLMIPAGLGSIPDYRVIATKGLVK
jgi:hypothetical protein